MTTLEKNIGTIVSEMRKQTALLASIDKRLAFAHPYDDEPGGKIERDRREAFLQTIHDRNQRLQKLKAAAKAAGLPGIPKEIEDFITGEGD